VELDGEARLQATGEALVDLREEWVSVAAIVHALAAPEAQPRVVEFVQWVKTTPLVGCWDWRPLLDGNALMKLGVPRGPALSKARKAEMTWRFANPGAGEAECTEFMKTQTFA